jgi:hypothetical protein
MGSCACFLVPMKRTVPPSATGRDEGVGGLDALQRLLEVDDVDAVALTEDEPLHLRVPAAGLVPEVDTGVEQLLHGDDGAGARTGRAGGIGRGRPLGPGYRPGTGRHEEHRRLAHHGAEQRGRVDVVVTHPGPQVEHRAGGTHHVAGADPVPHGHRDGGQVRVGRPDAIGVQDGHVELSGHGPGEHHQPRADRADRRTRDGLVLQPAVAGEPGLGRRPERVDHRRVERGPISRRTRPRAGRSGHDRRHQEQDDHQPGGPTTRSTAPRLGPLGGPSPAHHRPPVDLAAGGGVRPVRAGRPAGGSGAGAPTWCGSGSPGSR